MGRPLSAWQARQDYKGDIELFDTAGNPFQPGERS